MGEDFVFEDSDEEAPIWTFEDRLAGDASQRAEAAPAGEPRGVLDPQMADVLSAYSSEQGASVCLMPCHPMPGTLTWVTAQGS